MMPRSNLYQCIFILLFCRTHSVLTMTLHLNKYLSRTLLFSRNTSFTCCTLWTHTFFPSHNECSSETVKSGFEKPLQCPTAASGESGLLKEDLLFIHIMLVRAVPRTTLSKWVFSRVSHDLKWEQNYWYDSVKLLLFF